MPYTSESLLDNPAWHALSGPLARLCRTGAAEHVVVMQPEVGLFAGAETLDAAAWEGAAQIVGKGGVCAFVRDEPPAPPPGWEVVYTDQLVQMVGGDLPSARGHLDTQLLGAADVPEMLALNALTEAAPFFERTHELGRYIGLRRAGQLIAMAGERFRLPGFVEVSAVGTHPEARGAGLATELTLLVAESIRSAGNEVFLHCLASNENAIRLYEKLGFRVRRPMHVVFSLFSG